MSSSYAFRRGRLASLRWHRVTADALLWRDGRRSARVPYADLREVRVSQQRVGRAEGAENKRAIWCLTLHRHGGPSLFLSPLHYAGFRRWEDRSTAYVAFAQTLIVALRQANPAVVVVTERHWSMRLRRLVSRLTTPVAGSLLRVVMHAVRHGSPERTARAAGRLMRLVGPWLRGNRVARANLRAAFPDRSEDEVARLLEGMWDNFGRQMAEYAFLDRLWEKGRMAESPRIVPDPPSLARLHELRESGRPALFFGAHFGQWELPAAAATALGIRTAVVFRPPPSAAMEAHILRVRSEIMGPLIPARAGAGARLVQALRDGTSVGWLVDQHFVGGIDVMFFGRPCKVNPTPARLARRIECPIHGGRAVRLPDGRFRIEMTEALRPPRDSSGKIDVAGTMQMVTRTIEEWIREHPEQWLWMHRRWR